MPQYPADIELSSLNGTTGFKLAGATGSQAGFSVASAGDVNGDGFADVIVGAAGANASYVVFGQAGGFASTVDLSTLNGGNGFKLSGAADDSSGRSVASAGDINGDGYDDLIVGATGADPHGADSGAAYVVFGKAPGFASDVELSSLSGGDGFKLSGVAETDLAGFSVASAGDVNGDNIDDLIVGAPQANAAGSNSGAAYVVFGTTEGFASNIDLSGLDGDNGFRLSGAQTNSRGGFSVASAGDINGDGFDDIIVGAPYNNPFNSTAGQSYVVFGKASGFAANINAFSLNGDGTDGFRITGQSYSYSGVSVASAGDVNGDGFDDMIIGTKYGAYGNGDAYVVFGKASGFVFNIDVSSLDGSNGFRIHSLPNGGNTDVTAASAGDVNGDGFDDVIVGVKYANTNGSASGSSFVLFGKAAGFAADINTAGLGGDNGFELVGPAAQQHAGWSVAAAGDVNGDGLDDLIVGGPGGADGGAGYVVFGRAPTTPVVRISSDLSQALSGGSARDVLLGQGGDDRLFGNGSSDTLDGGDGDDALNGGTGSDAMIGGEGDDIYYVDSSTDVVTEFANEGTDTVYATASVTLAQHVENLVAGSDAGLTLRGNALANTVTGGDGNDILVGGGGSDALEGGAGNDRLNGGGGADTLAGGAGRDVLIGGADGDTFVFQALSDSLVGGQRDLIKDFAAGVDKIDLTQIDANTGVAGDQAFSFIGAGPFTHVAGELQAKALGANTLVSGDVDGNGTADFQILLSGSVALQATDFLL